MKLDTSYNTSHERKEIICIKALIWRPRLLPQNWNWQNIHGTINRGALTWGWGFQGEQFHPCTRPHQELDIPLRYTPTWLVHCFLWIPGTNRTNFIIININDINSTIIIIPSISSKPSALPVHPITHYCTSKSNTCPHFTQHRQSTVSIVVGHTLEAGRWTSGGNWTSRMTLDVAGSPIPLSA